MAIIRPSFQVPAVPGGVGMGLIDLTMGVHKPHHHIRLNRETKLDLGAWWEFFFNGMSFFLDESFLTGDYLQLYTDAAGGIGYGALCGTVVLW